MDKKNKQIIAVIIGGLLLFGGIIYGEIYKKNNISDYIPCYDNNDNIINGVTCTGVDINNQPIFIGLIIGFGGIILGISIVEYLFN